jgi:uncharacterized membrane protein HdeD (DUF308 family)
MTKFRRIREVCIALLMFVCSLAVAQSPEDGIPLIMQIIIVATIVKGMGTLSYYALMARHMVGGRLLLFKGIILLDIGMLFMTVDDVPMIYLVMYLAIGNLFSGAMDILRALEARRMESAWRLRMASGIANVITGVACLFCLGRPNLLVYIYAAGLFYSACLRLISAFRRTAIIYIA